MLSSRRGPPQVVVAVCLRVSSVTRHEVPLGVHASCAEPSEWLPVHDPEGTRTAEPKWLHVRFPAGTRIAEPTEWMHVHCRMEASGSRRPRSRSELIFSSSLMLVAAASSSLFRPPMQRTLHSPMRKRPSRTKEASIALAGAEAANQTTATSLAFADAEASIAFADAEESISTAVVSKLHTPYSPRRSQRR